MDPIISSPTAATEQRTVFWKNIRNRVKKVNPILTKIIDDLSPDTLPLTLEKYNYGAIIAEGARGGSFPTFLVLDKSCEVFFEYATHLMMFRLIKAGEMGIGNMAPHAPDWQNSLWKLSSGGQNVFLPAKISDYDKHKKIQDHFGFKVEHPLLLDDQRHTFNLIANSAKVEDQWQSEILVFDECWLQHKDDPAWDQFYHYLLQEELRHHGRISESHIFYLMTGILQAERDLKLTISQLSEMTQLIMMMLNVTPGFIALTDESVMPVKLIQNAFTEHYNLKNYMPTIMGPGYLRDTDHLRQAIYFALNHQCFFQFAPRENGSESHANAFFTFYRVFVKLLHLIQTKDYLHTDNLIYQKINSTEFNFYHPKSEGYRGFKPTTEIPLQDRVFAEAQEHGLQFPAKSHFFYGCVQIKKIPPPKIDSHP